MLRLGGKRVEECLESHLLPFALSFSLLADFHAFSDDLLELQPLLLKVRLCAGDSIGKLQDLPSQRLLSWVFLQPVDEALQLGTYVLNDHEITLFRQKLLV